MDDKEITIALFGFGKAKIATHKALTVALLGQEGMSWMLPTLSSPLMVFNCLAYTFGYDTRCRLSKSGFPHYS
jgi:hypothetical protein